MKRSTLLFALGYLALVAAVVWSLRSAREWALTQLATPESIENWQTWRDDVKRQQTEPGPVARRIPKSAEPPGLVLMRDNFMVCFVGALVFTSLLYWVLAWFVRGMLQPPSESVDST
jgi:hypothetical protein